MAKRWSMLAGWVFLTLNLCGCVVLLGAAAGGAGTALWLSGKLSDKVNAPYEKAIQASHKALQSLNMEIIKETHTEEVTQIKSQYTDASNVWIDIRPLSSGTSHIEIRVGIKGDKAASNRILEKIKQSL